MADTVVSVMHIVVSGKDAARVINALESLHRQAKSLIQDQKSNKVVVQFTRQNRLSTLDPKKAADLAITDKTLTSQHFRVLRR